MANDQLFDNQCQHHADVSQYSLHLHGNCYTTAALSLIIAIVQQM